MNETKLGAATLIRKLDGFRGDARLYKLDPPMQGRFTGYKDDEEVVNLHEHVVVSAAYVPFDSRHETYIFPATPDGKVIEYIDLPGSENYVYDHERVLRNAGYEIVD